MNGNGKILFSQRLRALRRERNLTQRAVSGRLNLSRTCLANYETGFRQPDPNTLVKLAQFYNVSVDYILATSDERNPYFSEKPELFCRLEKIRPGFLDCMSPECMGKILDYVEYVLAKEG
jgi:transcriptional regulator with XRE-family HTH domain